jgi:hypothetical protein
MENMINIDEIIQRHEELNKELRVALSTMEKSDRVKEIRKAIEENQIHCPHMSLEYSWPIIDNKCPYCGYKFKKNELTEIGDTKDASNN